MATKVPRINVTPTPELRALLVELHQVSGKSLSAIAAELLEEIAPVLRMQIEAMKAIQSAPEQARQIIQEQALQQIGVIGQAALEFEKQEDARTVRGKRMKRRRAANAPP